MATATLGWLAIVARGRIAKGAQFATRDRGRQDDVIPFARRVAREKG